MYNFQRRISASGTSVSVSLDVVGSVVLAAPCGIIMGPNRYLRGLKLDSFHPMNRYIATRQKNSCLARLPDASSYRLCSQRGDSLFGGLPPIPRIHTLDKRCDGARFLGTERSESRREKAGQCYRTCQKDPHHFRRVHADRSSSVACRIHHEKARAKLDFLLASSQGLRALTQEPDPNYGFCLGVHPR